MLLLLPLLRLLLVLPLICCSILVYGQPRHPLLHLLPCCAALGCCCCTSCRVSSLTAAAAAAAAGRVFPRHAWRRGGLPPAAVAGPLEPCKPPSMHLGTDCADRTRQPLHHTPCILLLLLLLLLCRPLLLLTLLCRPWCGCCRRCCRILQ
jgi:hypothetical protein